MNNNVLAAAILGACLIVAGLLAGGIYSSPLLINENYGAWMISNRFTGEGWICGLNMECTRAARFTEAGESAQPSPSPTSSRRIREPATAGRSSGATDVPDDDRVIKLYDRLLEEAEREREEAERQQKQTPPKRDN